MAPILTKTNWAGIVIETETTDSKAFVGTVNAALAKIDSKPIGKKLLANLVAEASKAAKNGGTVTIRPQKSVKKSFGPAIRWRTYNEGSSTSAWNYTKAFSGTGTASVIKWDPSREETPDGARPPFIALAHELIHAMYNLQGNADETSKTDEMRVTGLRGHESEPISENRIRQEHGIAFRASYFGKCDYAEGSPDESLF